MLKGKGGTESLLELTAGAKKTTHSVGINIVNTVLEPWISFHNCFVNSVVFVNPVLTPKTCYLQIM